jgi:hypothetical protein
MFVLRAATQEATGEGETRKRADAGREAVERRGGGSAGDGKDWVEKLRKDGSWRVEGSGRGGRGRKMGEQGTREEGESLRLASPAVERVCKSMEPVGWSA